MSDSIALLPNPFAETAPAETAANPFDQFDAPAAKAAGNPFDRFDAPIDHDSLIDAAKQGFAQEANKPLDPETVKALRDIGIFNDHTKGQNSIIRTFNEALVDQILAPLFQRLPMGLYGAVRGMAEAPPPSDLQGRLLQGVAGLATGAMEAFPRGFEGAIPHVGEPTAASPAYRAPTAGDLAAQREAVQRLSPENAPTVARPVSPEPFGPEVPPATPATPEIPEAPPAPDLHAVARGLEPDLFGEYDTLAARKDTLRGFLDDLGAQRERGSSPDIAKIDEQIDALRAQRLSAPPAERPGLANQITELETRRAELADALPKEGDTAEMARVRRDLQETDYRMRDLAPEVSAAYRRAAAGEEPAVPKTGEISAAPTEEIPPPEAPPAVVEAAPAAAENRQQPPETPGAAAEPPTPPGTVRFYHGGGDYAGGSRWLTEDRAYAEGYAAKTEGARVSYVDVPETWLEEHGIAKQFDDTGTDQRAPYVHFDAPEEIARNLKPLHAETEAASPAPTPETPAARPIEGGIAGDVAKQLTAAGRPAEEADAAGALVQAHYEARAARFNGAKGTAEDMYRAEAPDVVRGRQRVPEMAQAAEMEQPRRGKIRLADPERAARATITLFKDADASTFIHETGHHWLDEMMRDAADERAPADLTADAKTVRDYLGVEDGAEIPRKAHEKFARSFERYMMEGHAPSTGLARVFEQFKNWLTAIYERVARLRAPINDDIRAVFDRMLATPNEKPVIAPERPTESFAALHEADAEHTPPPEAGPVADAVRGERDKIGEAAHPEIDNERLDARASAENARGGTGGGVSGRGGTAAGPGAAPEGGISRPGPIGEGRSQAAPEGNRASGAGTADPAADFKPTDTKLVDKAGNIRLDNIDTPEDFKQAIRDSAERNGDFLGRRRGVVSDKQRDALADVLGTTPDKVLTREIGESFNDSEIKMLERALAQSSQHVNEFGAKFAATGAEADDIAFTQALLRHDMIQGIYSQATAEAGRALRALRRTQAYWSAEASATEKGLRNLLDDATGRTFNQRLALAQKISTLNQAGQVSRLVRDALKPGLFDWIQSAYINALLSGPFTHLGYTAAGEMFGLFRSTAEAGTSAGIGAVRRLFGADARDAAQIGEVNAQLYGQMRGSWRGLKASVEAIKTNQTVLPPETQRLPDQGALGAREIIPNPKIAGVKIPIGSTLEAPSRLVAALHSFNWTTFYEQAKAAEAFRIATKEGLAGDARSARIAVLVDHPSDAIIKAASEQAWGNALMARPAYDSIMGNVSRLTNAGWHLPDVPLPGGRSLPLGTLRPLKYIDPFVQIQANVQKVAFGRATPLALISKEVRDDLMMRNGGAAFDRTAGRIIAGTAFMTAAGGLYFAGKMNNSGPSDPREATLWRRTHGMPHGLNVGALSFDMMRLGNLGLQMSVAADLAHAVDRIGKDDATQVAGHLVLSFARNILDESFARGPKDLMEAVDDPDRYGGKWVRNFVTSAMPYSVGLGQVAREFDPNVRHARTLLDGFKAKLPYLSQEVSPLFDVWGEPVPSRGWAGTYYEHLKNDPIDRKLESLGIAPAPASRHVNNIELTEQQYNDYARIGGRYARMRVEQFLNQPGVDRAPPEAQIGTINHLIEGARRQAAGMLTVQSLGTADDIAAKRKAVQDAAAHGASHEEVKKLRKAQ